MDNDMVTSEEIVDRSTRDVASEATFDPMVIGPLTLGDQKFWLRNLDHDADARYRDCRLSNFIISTPEHWHAVERCRAYLAEIRDRVESGGGLLFLGKVGTGKDHLAFAIARGAIMRGYSAMWVNCLRWYSQMRDRIQRELPEEQAIRELVTPSLLVLSDPLPPVGELSQYQSSNLLLLIDRRYCARKPTILTVNLATEQDGWELVGPQAWDRLKEGAEIVWCKWASHRTLRTTGGKTG
jgi:DNA replication protein DnaC